MIIDHTMFHQKNMERTRFKANYNIEDAVKDLKNAFEKNIK